MAMVALPCQADSDATELSPPPISERKKRWAAKVKTGCATCRAMYKCIQHQDRLVEKEKLYEFSLAQSNESIRNILSINPNLAELSDYAQEMRMGDPL
ncbi:hypothetical protein E4U58_005911 [Claviceps cyperi]|nr:hypothetical protein E4U58_005911 [Claviceps cyperi]